MSYDFFYYIHWLTPGKTLDNIALNFHLIPGVFLITAVNFFAAYNRSWTARSLFQAIGPGEIIPDRSICRV
jgi:hypothetical protein